MGKYVRKGKVSGEVAVMEVTSHLGVLTRTRARSLLALQQPTKSSPSPSSSSSSSSYLQLRSRRLHKPFPAPRPPKQNPNANPKPSSGSNAGSKGSVRSCCSKRREGDGKKASPEASPETDGGVEVSFGENILEAEARDRDARETTPCSLIRDPETIGTPGSTTRPTSSAASSRRMQNSMRRNIPTTHEMEEFFAGAEQLQQRIFTEKYNFDPVNDHPLPGRYEWVKLDS